MGSLERMHTINRKKITGGRVAEKKEWYSLEEYLQYLRHKKVYVFAREYCKHKIILDYGCGLGYGSFFLSGIAKQVFGVDVEQKVIDFSSRNYRAGNLHFQMISHSGLNRFSDNYFDIVVSFQVIEHVRDVNPYLNEIKRVLKDDGIFFVSTPNKKHRLLPFQKPWNPDHLREYSSREFAEELGYVFKKLDIYGVLGTEEINEIERRRTKQTPLKAYFIQPVKRILKSYNIAIPNLFRKDENAGHYIGHDVLQKFTLDDFYVTKKNIDACLDYLAVCRNI